MGVRVVDLPRGFQDAGNGRDLVEVVRLDAQERHWTRVPQPGTARQRF